MKKFPRVQDENISNRYLADRIKDLYAILGNVSEENLSETLAQITEKIEELKEISAATGIAEIRNNVSVIREELDSAGCFYEEF